MSVSAIYFVNVFTVLLLATGVALTFFEFRRGELRAARARVRRDDARAGRALKPLVDKNAKQVR
ncbi:MAG: hypothetical protein ACJ74Q_11745 [Pyrinomonadaceae bacterium]